MNKSTLALLLWLWAATIAPAAMGNGTNNKSTEIALQETLFPKKDKETVPFQISEEEKAEILQQLEEKNKPFKEALERLTETSVSIDLDSLWITDDELELARPIIKTCNKGEILNLSYNNIEQVYYMQEMTNVRKLNLTYNKIEAIEGSDLFLWWNILEELDLSNNHIIRFSSLAVKNISETLKTLRLCDNRDKEYADLKLAELPEIELLEMLEILDVSNNKFKDSRWFHDLPNLKELYIQDNNITDLNGIKNLPSLQIINISNNEIWKISLIRSWGKDFSKWIVTSNGASIDNLKQLPALEEVILDKVVVENRAYFLYVNWANWLWLEHQRYETTEGKKGIKLTLKEEPTVIKIY